MRAILNNYTLYGSEQLSGLEAPVHVLRDENGALKREACSTEKRPPISQRPCIIGACLKGNVTDVRSLARENEKKAGGAKE